MVDEQRILRELQDKNLSLIARENKVARSTIYRILARHNLKHSDLKNPSMKDLIKRQMAQSHQEAVYGILTEAIQIVKRMEIDLRHGLFKVSAMQRTLEEACGHLPIHEARTKATKEALLGEFDEFKRNSNYSRARLS